MKKIYIGETWRHSIISYVWDWQSESKPDKDRARQIWRAPLRCDLLTIRRDIQIFTRKGGIPMTKGENFSARLRAV